MPQHHKILTQKTAHYYTLGTPGPHIKQFWLACHGYAQLADFFLEDLSILDDGHTLVVAPEATHYFYKKGFSGEVGATWMTKHHRDEAIADYVLYLQQLYDRYLPELPADVKIVLLGFSQGTATICRWVMHARPVFHDMVLWAGLPPEDLDYEAGRNYLSDKNLYLIYGTSDPFLTEDRLHSVQEVERQGALDFSELRFPGGHEMPDDVLLKLRQNL